MDILKFYLFRICDRIGEMKCKKTQSNSDSEHMRRSYNSVGKKCTKEGVISIGMVLFAVRSMTIINQFTKPIAIMKHGLERYGGERLLWSRDEKPTFLHILERIKEELQRAKETGLSFYPYGLKYKGGLKSIRKLGHYEKPIEIFFVPIKKERRRWPDSAPDIERIVWDPFEEKRFNHLYTPEEDEYTLPGAVRLWSGKSGGGKRKEYWALLIDELEVFTRKQKRVLDFSGQRLVHTSSGKPISTSMSGSLTFGVFKPDASATPMEDYTLPVVGRARLIPPYYGEVKR